MATDPGPVPHGTPPLPPGPSPHEPPGKPEGPEREHPSAEDALALASAPAQAVDGESVAGEEDPGASLEALGVSGAALSRQGGSEQGGDALVQHVGGQQVEDAGKHLLERAHGQGVGGTGAQGGGGDAAAGNDHQGR